jgi:hypothetical protein
MIVGNKCLFIRLQLTESLQIQEAYSGDTSVTHLYNWMYKQEVLGRTNSPTFRT